MSPQEREYYRKRADEELAAAAGIRGGRWNPPGARVPR